MGEISKKLQLPDFLQLEGVLPIEPNYYGAAKLISDQLGMQKPPNSLVYWRHGWDDVDLVDIRQCADLQMKNRTYLVATKEIEAFCLKNDFPNAKAVGLPFSYTNPDPTTQRIAGSLLVMPAHTLTNARESTDEIEYLDYIQSISHHFSRVVFCVNVACFVTGLWKNNLDKYGFDFVLGAGLMDQNALLRMRKLFDSFEYMTSNAIGSHILYAALCGVKVSLAGPYYNRDIESFKNQSSWQSPDYRKATELKVKMGHRDFVSKKYPWLFVEPQNAVERIEWAKKTIGLDNRLPPEALARLLFERNAEEVKNYLETIHQIDESNDFPKFLEFIQDKRYYDPDMMLSALTQLLVKLRWRSALILAAVLHERGHQDWLISFALQVSSLYYSQPMGKEHTLGDLRTQTDALSMEQQKNCYAQIILPTLSYPLLTTLKDGNDSRKQHIIEILQAAVPHFRHKTNWDMTVIDGVIHEKLF